MSSNIPRGRDLDNDLNNDLGPLPDELRGWNWGAFLLTWIWGLGNGVHISLLTFVPFVSYGMPFVLGAKGNKWAWEKKRYTGLRLDEDITNFKKSQRKWAIWGAIIIVTLLALAIVLSIATA